MIDRFLEIRLALFQLLQAAYAAPVTPDLADVLAEVVSEYNRLVDRQIPPLHPPAEQGESPEFHRLFVGPGPLVAPPYESVYRSAEPLLMQEVTLEVRAFYQAYGKALPPHLREPDDHLALELEFYAYLQTIRPLADGLPAQRRFWSDHLRRWIPAFTKRVIEGSRSPFYRSLAIITREVVAAEHQVLTALAQRLAVKEETTE